LTPSSLSSQRALEALLNAVSAPASGSPSKASMKRAIM
jgi:hypothetical protein